MIASLRGKIIFRSIDRVVVEAQGVGYDVAVSVPTVENLSQTEEVFLHIHTALRENALELYGFKTQEEKSVFEMLLTVAGIGPRTSLLILSGMPPDGLRQAILEGDLRKLTTIPGIGKKSAERIILELKEKMLKLMTTSQSLKGQALGGSLESDLISSLTYLGYPERTAVSAARKVLDGDRCDLQLSQAVKMALKELMK
jgi:Holliday junction DNA helicase RuvA